MAYYNKEDVRKYITDNHEIIVKKNRKSITPLEQALGQIDIENDIVGFFWMDIDDDGKGNVPIKMQGKIFVRITTDLYTDDRYAIDLHQAQLDDTTVSEIIKQRAIDTENAKKSLTPEVKKEYQNKLEKVIKPDVKK